MTLQDSLRENAPVRARPKVAYFTMEVALDDALPTFSGGLGVLAGDHLRSAADLALPLVAVSLLYNDGYFTQSVDSDGRQSERRVSWDPAKVLERVGAEITLQIGDRQVLVGAWRYLVEGASGAEVPVYFLDTDIDANAPEDRRITDSLYGGDEEHRLSQELLLGEGGVAMLEALGYDDIQTFHMNEGHASLLVLALLARASGQTGKNEPGSSRTPAASAVGQRAVFTTHTPVPAGHDRFDRVLVEKVLGADRTKMLASLGLLDRGRLDMTELGMRHSRFVNAVSRRHHPVAQEMAPYAQVTSVTNGVHPATWTATPMAELFDRSLDGWRLDGEMLRYARSLDLSEIAAAHRRSKESLIEAVRARSGVQLSQEAFTIGFARRVTPYKRTTLLFSDIDRLRQIARDSGPVQVVMSGKSHPRDEGGKRLIVELARAAKALSGAVEVVFVENYDLAFARSVCAGADLWLNTPEVPNEASGTSGMKAALNGVPSLSVLDGWWVEGCIDGVTGWAIGDGTADAAASSAPGGVLAAATLDSAASLDRAASLDSAASDARSLYERLEKDVLPLYNGSPDAYLDIRRQAIAVNGSFFCSDRMVREYAVRAYGVTTHG